MPLEPLLAVQYQIVVNPEMIPPEKLPALLDRLADLQPLLFEIGGLLSRDQYSNLDAGGGRYGEWPELAESTIRQKTRQGYPLNPLIRTGNLAAHLGTVIAMNNNAVTVGMPIEEVPYAVYHEYGGANDRPPQRVIVAVSAEEEDEFFQIIADFIGEVQGLPPGAVTVITQQV